MIEGRAADGTGIRVTVDGGMISAVAAIPDPGPDAPWVLPGLVDLQVNGFAGHDANGEHVDTQVIAAMAEALARVGTTTFVPTVITGPAPAILQSLRAIVAARQRDPVLAGSIPFIHIEGPHLSERDGPRGAHDLDQIRPPSVDEFAAWQEAAEGLIGMVTMSPHWPGTTDYVRGLTAQGVRVSLGHSHAEAADFRAAADAGAAFSTHLGNGISATLPRHPNPIWTQLADDRLTAGFIADGHHLPGEALKSMLRAKGLDRSFVVSDSAALAGSAPGRYRTPVGGEVELHADGRLNVADTPYLAGAALPLVAAIGTLTRCGFGLPDIVRLTSTNPGRIAGHGGTLEIGARADVLVADIRDGVARPIEVWLAGTRLTPA